jgi:hypothetical protein
MLEITLPADFTTTDHRPRTTTHDHPARRGRWGELDAFATAP